MMIMETMTKYLLEQVFETVKNAPVNERDVSALLERIESYNSSRSSDQDGYSRANHDVIVQEKIYDDFIGAGFKGGHDDYLFYRLVHATEDDGHVVSLHVIQMEINKGDKQTYILDYITMLPRSLKYGGHDPLVSSTVVKDEMEKIIESMLKINDECYTRWTVADYMRFGSLTEDREICEIYGWFEGKPIALPVSNLSPTF